MINTHRSNANDSVAAPLRASVNHNGLTEAGRAHMHLSRSEDGRYRWIGDDGSDTEVSGRTRAEAVRLARQAWSGAEWDFRLEPAPPVGGGKRKYEISDEGSTEIIEADSMDDAIEQAKDWIRDGDWDDDGTTSWVSVCVTDLETGESDGVKVQIEPEEPPCTPLDSAAGEADDLAVHDWHAPYEIVGGIRENPGVWGSGGGVRIHEACLLCGCAKITYTWAQDPSDGEQGLTSITYEPGRYAEEVRRYKQERES